MRCRQFRHCQPHIGFWFVVIYTIVPRPMAYDSTAFSHDLLSVSDRRGALLERPFLPDI